MERIINIIQITAKAIAFVLAEVIPFGRAIQKLFKDSKNGIAENK